MSGPGWARVVGRAAAGPTAGPRPTSRNRVAWWRARALMRTCGQGGPRAAGEAPVRRPRVEVRGGTSPPGAPSRWCPPPGPADSMLRGPGTGRTPLLMSLVDLHTLGHVPEQHRKGSRRGGHNGRHSRSRPGTRRTDKQTRAAHATFRERRAPLARRAGPGHVRPHCTRGCGVGTTGIASTSGECQV